MSDVGRRPFPLRIPFVETLGAELWRFDSGRAELRMDVGEAHQNNWHVAHGGVLMTLLDVAMAHAARSARIDAMAAAGTPEPGPGMATVEMKTSFMRPAVGRVRAEGEVLHRTNSMAFCESRILDESGRVCAHATGTFKYLRKPPTPSAAPPPPQPATASPETPA